MTNRLKPAETYTHTHTHTSNSLLSLKQIGTICLSILIPTFSVFATPDIASNANGNGSCVEPVLHRYDGTANLQAGWQANTIQLKWYNGDTQLDVQDAADSCTYDGALTLPSTQPTKTGYTFAGWRVKTAAASGGLCGLTSSIVGAEITSSVMRAYDAANSTDVCRSCEENCNTVACSGTGLNQNEWKVTSSYGTYRGSAVCSEQNIDMNTVMAQYEALVNSGMSEDDAVAAIYGTGAMSSSSVTSSNNGTICWCRAESYTSNSGSQCSLSTLAWVFGSEGDSAYFCAGECVEFCARIVQTNLSFRAAVFGVASN